MKDRSAQRNSTQFNKKEKRKKKKKKKHETMSASVLKQAPNM